MAKSIEERIFYHGTDRESVPGIEKEGLNQGDGHLSSGVYVSESWRTAMAFGPYLYEVTLKPGTRILDLSTPLDRKVITYLQKEFKGIVKAENPWNVLPRNKHLTKSELINLMKYFFGKITEYRSGMKFTKLMEKMDDAVLHYYRGALIRHGYHGYGHPTSDTGFAIFCPDRIVSATLKTSTTVKQWWANIEEDFKKFDTLEDYIKATEACNANIKKANHQP